MKKILLVAIISVSVLVIAGGNVLATPGADCGGTTGLSCDPGEVCDTHTNKCKLASPASTQPPETLKECCKLGSNIKITSGKINVASGISGAVKDKNGTEINTETTCTKENPCFLQKDFTVGKTSLTSCPTQTDPNATPDIYTDTWGMVCILNTIYVVVNWVFYLMLIAVVLMGVTGGVLYMTSAGDSEKTGKAKNVIIYAIVGLVIAMIAKLVPSVVRMIVGM